MATRVYATDIEDIELKNFSLAENQSSSVTFNDKVYLDIDLGISEEEIPENLGVHFFIVNKENNSTPFYISGTTFLSKCYIELSGLRDVLTSGEYQIYGMLITLGEEFKQFSETSNGEAIDIEFTIFENQIGLIYSKMELRNVNFADQLKTMITFEDKLYLDLDFGISQEEFEALPHKDIDGYVWLRNMDTGDITEKHTEVIKDIWRIPYVELDNLKDELSVGRWELYTVWISFGGYDHYYSKSGLTEVLNSTVEFYLVEDYDVLNDFKLVGENSISTSDILKFDVDCDIVPTNVAIGIGDGKDSYIVYLSENGDYYTSSKLNELYEPVKGGNYKVQSINLFYNGFAIVYSNETGHAGIHNDLTYDVEFTVLDKEKVKNISLQDKATKIKLETELENLPENTELKAGELKSGKVFELVEKALDNANKFILYDINLLSENVKVQPNGKVKLSLPIPEGYDSARVKVVRITDEGKVIDYETTVKDGFAVIETDHFSNYAVVEQKEEVKAEEPKTEEVAKVETTETRAKDNTPKTGVVGNRAVFVIVFAMIVFVAVMKIRKNQKKN
ncbi:MAG: hypothetical protein IJ867_04560 [Clostridia bacterium]|nr:hypothetical protein [Clostridia bacterium]